MRSQSSSARATALRCSNFEPALDDLLTDPIVRMLMDSDHVGLAEMDRLIRSAKQRQYVEA